MSRELFKRVIYYWTNQTCIYHFNKINIHIRMPNTQVVFLSFKKYCFNHYVKNWENNKKNGMEIKTQIVYFYKSLSAQKVVRPWPYWPYIPLLMYMFLNEVKFNLRMRIICLHEFSLSNNYIVFVENHTLWRIDCTQWFCSQLREQNGQQCSAE